MFNVNETAPKSCGNNIFSVRPRALHSVNQKHLTQTQDIVKMIENTPKGAQDRPIEDVVIYESGEIAVEKPFAVTKEASKK